MSQSLRILSVDDNEYDREIIRRALTKSGLDVDLVEAETSQQAQALLETDTFDCMLLDYLLPPTNGLELLKAQPDSEALPAVIMLTGMGDEKIAVEAMKSGVQEYISKNDMSAQSISHAIQHAMESRQVMREKLLRQSELEQMSFYDQLTGLANRNLLMNRLTELIKISKRCDKNFCVLLMDLNGFKAVNDTLGHAGGDSLLKEIATRLAETSRVSDTVARLGGDEFIILLSDVEDYIGASTVARKIIESIDQPIKIEDQFVQVSASLGISMYPDHGDDVHTLIRHADMAMYKAKQNKLGFTVFSSGKDDRRSSRISSELPDILLHDNLILHYQPKVDLGSGQMCGAEVLIRWHHPALGLLPPQEFIPVAEKSMLIRELSYKVMDKAMKQYHQWVAEGRHIPLSINLSSRMLSDHDLAERIENIRLKHGIDASHFTLEVTESALITDPRRACKILDQLVAIGFRVSIDDFGMGYSSLSYLRDFPIHEIKIDKSFVQSVQHDVRNSYIIEAIVGLAKSFGALSVAEGIENVALWKQLQLMGCDIGQGFYIGRPISSVDLEKWQHDWINADHRPAHTPPH